MSEPEWMQAWTDDERKQWQASMDIAFLKLLTPLYDRALAHEAAMERGEA